MRIYNYYLKMLIVVLVWIFINGIGDFLHRPLGLAVDVAAAIAPFLSCALVYGVTRVFRTPGESPDPRPWWQMTGKPTAAFWIALVPLLLLIGGVISVGVVLLNGDSVQSTVNWWALPGTLLYGGVGVLYYVTWWKLKNGNPRVTEPA